MTTILAECHVNLNPLVELVEEEEKELTKRKQRKDDKPGIGGCEVAAFSSSNIVTLQTLEKRKSHRIEVKELTLHTYT